jgi:hypothetical protein
MRLATILTPRPLAITSQRTFITTRRFFKSRGAAAIVRSAVALLLIFSLTPVGSVETFAQSHKKTRKKSTKPKSFPCNAGCKPATSEPLFSGLSPEAEPAQHELSLLALNLHLGTPGAYDKLSSFATKNAANAWGARAALALGYDDLTKSHAQQALAWFTQAKNDPLLTEYVLYWSSQAKHALNRNAESLADLATIQKDFPGTALKEQLVTAIAAQSLEAGHPQQAIDALNSYSATANKPSLLIERARTYNMAGKPLLAAKDYQTVYYKFALADETSGASTALTQLNKQLHGEFPYATAELQQQRAQAFYEAHKWKEARSEFEKLTNILHDPANPVRQHAQLRVAQARMQPKGSISLLMGLKFADPEVEAERLYTLSQVYRSEKKEAEMLSAIEDIAQKFPQSRWAEEGLMSAGNYFWVLLDRARAAAYYQRVLDVFPGGKNAFNAEWRMAWVAYLGRQPYADDRLTAFLRKYPVSIGWAAMPSAPAISLALAAFTPRPSNVFRKLISRVPPPRV